MLAGINSLLFQILHEKEAI